MSQIHGIIMSACRVDLWYNKQRVNKKNGLVSIYLEIAIAGEIDYIKIKGLKWTASAFDWNKRALLPRSKDDQDLAAFQALIETERNKYWKIIKAFLLEDRFFSLSDVFRTVNMFKSGSLFCSFMDQAIRDRQKTLVKADMIKESTADGHKATLIWLRKYLKNGDIEISQLDGDVLEKFAVYLAKHMAEGSVWKRVQNVKSYLSYAFRHKISINHDYHRFKASKPEPDPTWLDESEVKHLLNIYYGEAFIESPGRESVRIELSAEQRRDCRAFLFACFTGLRVSDLSRWNKQWLKGDYISFIPVKRKKSVRNPKPIIIPVIPIARQFIEDMTTNTFEIPAEPVYNRGLKVLGSIAGLDKNLTSHVARHTFATWLAIDGIPVEAISKLLGHKKTETTMIYIHIAKDYLAVQMLKMQNRFGLRPSPVLKIVQ